LDVEGQYLRSARRRSDYPSFSYGIGFRLVRS
jgi:hypothetical protein